MTSNDSMGLNYRRRVIYHALRETFTDPLDIRGYFQLWQSEHSHEAHFVVTRFAAVVAKRAGFDAQQKSTFQRRLFQGLSQPYDELPRVPDAWLPAANTGEMPAVMPAAAPIAPPPTAPLQIAALDAAAAMAPRLPTNFDTPVRSEAPERVVFKALVQPLIGAILAKADRHPGVLDQVLADLERGKRDARDQALMQLLGRWGADRFDVRNLPLLRDPEELRFLAHKLYLIAADLLGPMQADRLLAQSVSACEALPEAMLFSPQQLL